MLSDAESVGEGDRAMSVEFRKFWKFEKRKLRGHATMGNKRKIASLEYGRTLSD